MYVYTHLPILQLALTNSPFLDVCLLWSACLCLYSLLEQSVFFHNSFLARLSTFSGASSAKEGPIHLPIWRYHQIVIKILFKHFCKYSKYLCLPSRELTYPTKREVRKNIDSKGAGDCRGYVIVPRRVLVKSDTPPPLFHHGLHHVASKVPLSKDPAHSQEPPWCRFGTEVLRHTSNLLKEFPTSGNVGEEQVNGCFLGYGNNTIWNSTYLFGKWWSFTIVNCLDFF